MVSVFAAALLGSGAVNAQDQPPEHAAAAAAGDRPALVSATSAERATLDRFMNASTWLRRAVAAMRLERYGDGESLALLLRLRDDPDWQVRAYAIRSLARRGVPAAEDWFAEEQEPRVVRTLLRHRYAFDHGRLERGMRFLLRSNSFEDWMLAAELGAASGDDDLRELAKETTRKIILRMDRAEGGALSARLAVLTGQPDLRRQYLWQDWLLKIGRRFDIVPAYAVGEGRPAEPSLLASLPSDRFAALEDYMTRLKQRKLDLAICLDCTASMYSEIAEAQAGLDDLMLFVGDAVGELRVAIVAYRDRRDEFKTKAWDFTGDLSQARAQLWQLSADGGGDSPEAVHDALELAYTKLTWRPESDKVLVLVGDAPPHLGLGSLCASMAGKAHDMAQLKTHTIQAEGKPVKHFDEIARAGGGKCITLEEDGALIAEITGLSIGDTFEPEFTEFFQVYLELCR